MQAGRLYPYRKADDAYYKVADIQGWNYMEQPLRVRSDRRLLGERDYWPRRLHVYLG
jgi:hypothetical protein